MLRGAVDRSLLRVACWIVRRLRARGPLPTPLLVAAGLVRVVDGDAYAEWADGLWVRQPDAYDRPVPPRPDAWRRSAFWSKDPDPPPPSPWVRES
jgi:hypothetical protein